MPMPTSSIRKLKRLAAATLAIWLLPLGAHASVEDFHFDSFQAEYRITIDRDGLAMLNVQETLVPVIFLAGTTVCRLKQKYSRSPMRMACRDL